MLTLADAKMIAEMAHYGQVDKAGVPYIEHPAAVARLVEARGFGELAVSCAWLHDVAEDTDVTLEALAAFGASERQLLVLDALTRRDGEAYDDYVRRVVRSGSRSAIEVKAADLAHNLDPDRLALLGPKQAQRLRERYARALDLLRDLPPTDASSEVQ